MNEYIDFIEIFLYFLFFYISMGKVDFLRLAYLYNIKKEIQISFTL